MFSQCLRSNCRNRNTVVQSNQSPGTQNSSRLGSGMPNIGAPEYLWPSRRGAFLRPGYSARTSAAMLTAIRSADSLTESRARWA